MKRARKFSSLNYQGFTFPFSFHNQFRSCQTTLMFHRIHTWMLCFPTDSLTRVSHTGRRSFMPQQGNNFLSCSKCSSCLNGWDRSFGSKVDGRTFQISLPFNTYLKSIKNTLNVLVWTV